MSASDMLFSPNSLTVMIVDDHDPIRKGIRRVALAMGFGEVVECFDGDEAIKMLAKKPVDLLICDLYMRNVSGFAVLEHVRNREIGCDIPAIIVTGEGGKDEIVKVADLGAEDYVLKPFQATELEKKIVKTLNKFYSPPPLIKALRRAERHYLAREYDKALAAFDAALAVDAESARAGLGKSRTLERRTWPTRRSSSSRE
jgi:CheY-like chemotaxis protein